MREVNTFAPAHKIGVFVSSKMENSERSKYTCVRKNLHYLLMQNEMIQINSMDGKGAADSYSMSEAFRMLEKSHICVFIFDEEDEIRENVKREHERAKEKGIARLYYFCGASDESKIHETVKELKRELETNDKEGRLYGPEKSFTDIAYKAYTNIMEEITKGYQIYREAKQQAMTEKPLPYAGAAEDVGFAH